MNILEYLFPSVLKYGQVVKYFQPRIWEHLWSSFPVEILFLLLTAFSFYCNLHMLERLVWWGLGEGLRFLFLFV